MENESKIICSSKPERNDDQEMDIYSIIRSEEIRDYYRQENYCDNWEKKAILILHGFISVQQKMAMLKQLSGTGTVEENSLTEEMCHIFSRYIDMILHPSVRTLFLLQIGEPRWDTDGIDDNLAYLDNAYDSLDEVIVRMKEICDGIEETVFGLVTVLQVPADEKVKNAFAFPLYWIKGKYKSSG